MKLTIIGTGYVGLVSGACFAELGHDVICVDTNEAKIAALKNGECPIYEKDLPELLRKNHGATLGFSASLADSLDGSDVVMIAVGTPTRNDGTPDLSQVYGVTEEIAALAGDQDFILVTKSTVPVGTGIELTRILQKAGADNVEVAANPEFLREGSAVADFLKPDRVVIGVESERAEKILAALYAPLTERNIPLVVSKRATAELTKYAANTFLAVKIAFINEMADIAETCGADVEEVAHAIGLDKRIGGLFLKAGPGFGGSCFPKDTLALLHLAKASGLTPALTDAVVTSNEARKAAMAEKIIAACGGSVKDKMLAVLGLTYKAGTDDMRDAASLTILPLLLEAGAILKAYDPQGMKEAANLLPKEIIFCTSAEDTTKDSDAAIILTEWPEFRALKPEWFKQLKTPLLIDLRNLFSPKAMQEAGMKYYSVGRQAL